MMCARASNLFEAVFEATPCPFNTYASARSSRGQGDLHKVMGSVRLPTFVGRMIQYLCNLGGGGRGGRLGLHLGRVSTPTPLL